MRTYAIRICDPCFALQGEMCHVPGCVFCRETMAEVGRLLDVLMLRPVIDGERITAATPEPEPRTPIRWLGDDTQPADYYDLRERYPDRFTVLGGPTTLYFKMDDGTRIIVPHGWWICDSDGAPFVSSAAPTPPPPAGNPEPAVPVAAILRLSEEWERRSTQEGANQRPVLERCARRLRALASQTTGGGRHG